MTNKNDRAAAAREAAEGMDQAQDNLGKVTKAYLQGEASKDDFDQAYTDAETATDKARRATGGSQ